MKLKKIIKKDTMTFNLRVPFEIWSFLRENAFKKEVSMNAFIVAHLEKLKNRSQKSVDTQ